MTSTRLTLIAAFLLFAPIATYGETRSALLQAWYAAIESNNTSKLTKLAKEMPDVNLLTPERNKSAIMAAAAAGDVKLTKLLISVGADPRIPNYNSGTSLMYACWGGNYAVAKTLLDNQLSPEIDSQASNGWTAMMMCSVKNRGLIVRLLLSRQADPNIADIYGWTPLMRAAYEGKLESLTELLAVADTRVDLRNFNGQTALHLAAAGKQKSAYQQLLSHGSDPQLSDKLGYSASDIARMQNLFKPID